MKIAYLISNYFPTIGGAQGCVHSVANGIIDKGHCAVVITPTPGGKGDKNFKYEIIRISPILNKLLFINYPIGKFYLERILTKIQKRYNFDLWQVTVGYPLGAASADFFNKKKIPCVLRCSGEDIQVMPEVGYGYRLNRNIDAIVRDNYRKFSALIAAGNRTKQDYLTIGVPENKIFIISNGVDLAKFRAGIDRKGIREELGVGTDEKLIITVGRNHPKKGYRYIPIIMKRLLGRGIRFKWLLVGKGCEGIRSFAKDEGIGEYLITREIAQGFSDEGDPEMPDRKLIEYYMASDIFVFPTFIELFAKVLIEALAAGLPIVTTNARGVDDIIRNEENGLKCDTGDPGCMAESIIRIFSDQPLAKRLGENALRDAENYDWAEISDRYIRLYEKIIIKPVKIAHIITDLDIGGAEMMLLKTLRNVKDKKYEHFVISLDPKRDALRKEIEQEGFKVYALSLSARNFLFSFIKLFMILRKEKPKIAHSYLFHADIFGRIAAKLAGVPIVVSSLRNENIGGRMRELILGMTDFCVDRVTAVSRNVAELHIRKGTTKKKDVTIIYNGVEFETSEGKNRSAIRQGLGIGKDVFLLLTIANLEPKKGHIFLLEALSKLKNKGYGFKMFIVGSGKEANRLEDEIKNRDLKNEVLLMGRIRNLSDLLSAADVFILPSLWEGLPNALLEAMSAGLPVIATRVGGIPEVLTDGETGILVDPKDSGALAGAIERLLRDEKLRAVLSRNAQEYTKKYFDIKNTVVELDRFYAELLEKDGNN